MTKAFFITGTDTGIGKTYVTCRLLEQAASREIPCCGFKPVAAGAITTPDGLRNEDALNLQQASSIDLDYRTINPYLYEPAIAPHVAATDAGGVMDIPHLLEAYGRIRAKSELVLIEGAGGWKVPVCTNEGYYSMADLAELFSAPVVLVVGMRLGCINHALLSAESICRTHRLAGWIANCLPPLQSRLEDNIAYLRDAMPAPMLGVVNENGGLATGRNTLDALLEFQCCKAGLPPSGA